MVTTALSNQNNLFCLVRKCEVHATPEEWVRQKLLAQMIEELGYPSSFLAVEKKLSELPLADFSKKSIPNRRVDVVCYGAGASFEPLLLIECKANSYGDKEMRQLLGYNYYVGARFLALVNPQKTTFLSVVDQQFRDHLPSYSQLFLDL